MRAFHNDPKIKKTYLARVEAHRKADELVQGYGYWKDGKGCAVGCTIHGDTHKSYETELGIPEWLAQVEDTLFEGLSKSEARKWPTRFLKAIKPGADLEQAKAPFLIVVLESTLKSMAAVKVDAEKFPDVAKALEGSKAAVQQMIEAQKSGDKKKIDAARSAAAAAAESAAWSARSAESAAWSARSAESAAGAARSAEYKKFADALIKILEGCK